MRYLAVVLMLSVAACSQPPATRSGEVLLVGRAIVADAGEGLLRVGVTSARGARGAARALDPPATVDLRLSLFGRPPCLTRTDTASLLRQVTAGAGVTMVVAKADPAVPAMLAVLDLAIDGLPALGRPKPPWPNLRDSTAGDEPTVPILFPVLEDADWHDTWLKPLFGNLHTGQDLRGPRMTPLVACFGGVVWLEPKADPLAANSLVILGDAGWEALYAHLNNDTPGTTDNAASRDYAFAPGIENGARVVPGQVVGWMGDSGFATGPHLHFELRGPDKQVHTAAPSLRAARHLVEPARVAVWPALRPAPGQVRLDGIVKSVNVGARRLYLGVRYRNGVPLSGPLYVVIGLGDDAAIRIRGEGTMELSLAQLTPGSAVAVVADPGLVAPTAREIWLERQGLVVDETFRSTVDALARAGA